LGGGVSRGFCVQQANKSLKQSVNCSFAQSSEHRIN